MGISKNTAHRSKRGRGCLVGIGLEVSGLDVESCLLFSKGITHCPSIRIDLGAEVSTLIGNWAGWGGQAIRRRSGFPKVRGPFFGGPPMTSIIVFWGVYWIPLCIETTKY